MVTAVVGGDADDGVVGLAFALHLIKHQPEQPIQVLNLRRVIAAGSRPGRATTSPPALRASACRNASPGRAGARGRPASRRGWNPAMARRPLSPIRAEESTR